MKKLNPKLNAEKKKKKFNSVKFRVWFKVFKYKLLMDILIYASSFGLAFLFYKEFETLFIFLAFHLCRGLFPKKLHLKSTISCIKLTLFIFSVAVLIVLPNEISKIAPLILGVLICLITYFVQDYLDFLTRKDKGLVKGMSEEDMIKLCKEHRLTELETKVMILYYCKCMKRWEIGNELNYSQDNISKIKKRALDKLV